MNLCVWSVSVLLRRLPGLLALLLVAGSAWAQQPTKPVVTDSMRTQPETRRDSLRRRFDQERVLTGLKAYTKRKTIAGKAASAIFNFTERKEDQVGIDVELLDRQFDQHNYKIVRRIDIRALDAFGYSVSDPTRQPRNILERTGNSLHVTTSRARVRQLLLFRVGEELAPQALTESERLLRQTDELLDARVFVDEETTTQDSVDIRIITKDVFSIGGSFELRDVGAGVIAARDVNFLGQGHQINNRFEYGRTEPQSWSYEGSYVVPFRNFINGQVRYRNEFQYEEKAIGFSRDFYSLNTRYAGAVSLRSSRQGIAVTLPDKPTFYLPSNYSIRDAWLGRSFRLRSYDLGYENPARLIVSGRVLNTNYTARPNPDYLNSTVVLGTVGYSVRRYYKDKYLFGFGRTEDIPTGTLLSLTAGYDFNDQANRHYYAVRAATGGFSMRNGYLYLSGEFGSYVRQRDKDWQQGLLSTEVLYFTRLYHTGNWQWRHFFWNRSALGFNRRADEQGLLIDGNRGLRGFESDMRGTSRFVLNYETTVFTPVSFLGFRVAGVAFVDAAWLANKPGQELPFRNTPYTGFGLGLRLRNEYIAVRTVQLLLGYYPRGQTNPGGFRVFENARPYYGFSDFNFAQPNTVRYE
ncbi:hypothetical protein [Hymenobacter cellulosilyticus]|uniref:Bacterial surface antigen (D15) domain-containing protein n=1 Tax=Hymenobacter cellulosilyticus TaxID=2932248 RepID=A0A8T9QEH5_9BACT|nr:hypothetical protein [Hymenobacter cellulosilyticus]UOQ74240.1 hypothetical protein MUN79_10335 [Hymenobacter cellulosilyticus]